MIKAYDLKDGVLKTVCGYVAEKESAHWILAVEIDATSLEKLIDPLLIITEESKRDGIERRVMIHKSDLLGLIEAAEKQARKAIR